MQRIITIMSLILFGVVSAAVLPFAIAFPISLIIGWISGMILSDLLRGGCSAKK